MKTWRTHSENTTIVSFRGKHNNSNMILNTILACWLSWIWDAGPLESTRPDHQSKRAKVEIQHNLSGSANKSSSRKRDIIIGRVTTLMHVSLDWYLIGGPLCSLCVRNIKSNLIMSKKTQPCVRPLSRAVLSSQTSSASAHSRHESLMSCVLYELALGHECECVVCAGTDTRLPQFWRWNHTEDVWPDLNHW